MAIYWLCFPLWVLATALMSWHYAQAVKPLTERLRLVDEPIWLFVRFGVLASAVGPILIWGHWAVGVGAIILHTVFVMWMGARATSRQVQLEARRLLGEGLPSSDAVTRAEMMVEENVTTILLPSEFYSFGDEPERTWEWLRGGTGAFWSLFLTRLNPFFHDIRREQIAKYQDVLDSIFEVIDTQNYHPRGNLTQIQQDNERADSIAKVAAGHGLSPFYIQVMLTQFFWADLAYRTLDKDKWAWVCQRLRPIDYFPSASVVAERDFASGTAEARR